MIDVLDDPDPLDSLSLGATLRLSLGVGAVAGGGEPESSLTFRIGPVATTAQVLIAPWGLLDLFRALEGRTALVRDDLLSLVDLAEHGCLDARTLRLATKVVRGTG